MTDASAERAVRIASWNIHGAIGTDGVCSPERIARIIGEMKADIVVLQEVDGRVHLRRQPEAFETMAALLGEGHVAEARLTGKPGREHGNLIWSRWPILSRSVHLLPGGLEQRGVVEARVATPAGDLTVIGTHLGLSPITRLRQAAELVCLVRQVPAAPCVLLGDLNEWMRCGVVHRQLSAVLPRSLRPATFPTRSPFARLDRLYATADIGLSLVAAPAGARIASDHLPIIVDLTLSR